MRQGRAEARRRRDGGERRRRVDAGHRDGDRRRRQRRGRPGYAGRSPDNPANEAFMKWMSAVEHLRRRRAQAVLDVVRRAIPRNSAQFCTFERRSSPNTARTSRFVAVSAAAQRLNGEFIKGAPADLLALRLGRRGRQPCACRSWCSRGRARRPTSPPLSAAPARRRLPGSRQRERDQPSSGGFSGYRAQPARQKDAVAGYLSSRACRPATRGYNISGRAYPDVSARRPTSASRRLAAARVPHARAPTFAGVMLLNVSLQAGRAEPGLPQPSYRTPPRSTTSPRARRRAAASRAAAGRRGGWDAVTGLGTPNFAALSKIGRAP